MSRSPVPDFFLKYKNEEVFNAPDAAEDVFKHFDANKNNALNLNCFENLLKALFSCRGRPYPIPREKVEEIFCHFNSKDDNMLLTEFQEFWDKFVKHVLHPKNSIVIVDVQNDFIDGSLGLINCPAKQDGAEVVPVINELIDTVPFDAVAYTLDWHPQDHCSFIDNVNMRKLSDKSPTKKDFKLYDTIIFDAFPDADQKLWPAHCVQNTKGSELHPDLKQVDPAKDEMKRKVVYCQKGNKPDIDSYSAFFDNAKLNETTLDKDLKSHSITDIYVCGLALDVCVAATAYDGLGLKYRTILIEDACRGIDVDDIEAKKKMLCDNGAVVVSAKHVYNMIIGRDRRPELGYAILGIKP